MATNVKLTANNFIIAKPHTNVTTLLSGIPDDLIPEYDHEVITERGVMGVLRIIDREAFLDFGVVVVIPAKTCLLLKPIQQQNYTCNKGSDIPVTNIEVTYTINHKRAGSC